jgi:hypothetical protein
MDLRYNLDLRFKLITKLIFLFLSGATKLLSARRLKLVQKENLLLEREKMQGEQKMR